MKFTEYKNFTVTVDDRGVVRCVLDVPGRPLNVLDATVMAELENIVCEIEGSEDAKLLVIESGKESGFLAGADVSVIAAIESADEALHLIEDGQLLFQRIEWLPIPTIAVIHGPCLGGGLELSLACNHRIARDNSSTVIGLPEIKLGLIPGWGGTQRLPKLVGLTESLDMIMQGKTKDARTALKIGLIDRAIAPEDWDEEVNAFIEHVLSGGYITLPSTRRSLRRQLMEETRIGRALIFNATSKRIARKVRHYPALKSALTAIKHSYRKGVDGFACERQEFVKLLPTMTCRSLLKLFFSREKARSLRTWSSAGLQAAHDAPIRCVGVVGAGTMGAGIAQLSAVRGFDVVVKEIDRDSVAAGAKRITTLIDKLAERKGWSRGKRDSLLSQITITCESDALAEADLVVEAIVERMDIKKDLFSKLESTCKSKTILATNTSSLSVDEMSDHLNGKSSFGGLHFFNPVHRMDLVEVVRGKQTSDETVARLVSFVRALGKTPIVTSDSPGFLVNRVLFPYVGEAVMMTREGIDVGLIDKELKRFGMPMGPLELLDQVGLDIAFHVASSLKSVLKNTEKVTEVLSEMVAKGHLGKKSGTGFYSYRHGKKGAAMPVSAVVPRRSLATDFLDDGLSDIQRRLVYPMLAESVRCLEEKVVDEAWAIDLGMILGTGFAPHTGGPLHVLDAIGTKCFSKNSKRLAAMYGNRFNPPRSLSRMSDAGSTFFLAGADLAGESHVAQ